MEAVLSRSLGEVNLRSLAGSFSFGPPLLLIIATMTSPSSTTATAPNEIQRRIGFFAGLAVRRALIPEPLLLSNLMIGDGPESCTSRSIPLEEIDGAASKDFALGSR